MAILKIKPQKLYLQVIFSCFLASVCIAKVSADCSLYSPAQNIFVDYSRHSDVQIKTSTPFTIDPVEYNLQWQDNNWKVTHNYLALGFSTNHTDAPQTNGHLHRFSVGYSSTMAINSIASNDTLHWSIRPTIAVSSNQLKHLHSQLPKNLAKHNKLHHTI